MLKYVDTLVGFSEVPDEISLCINISGCKIKCPECHSKHLWEDIGEPLNKKALINLILANKGISCICFMGGDLKQIQPLAEYVKKNTYFKTCWYTGLELDFSKPEDFKYLDYVKTGPYKPEFGPLNNPNTNQRFFNIKELNGVYEFNNITNKFLKNED